MKKIKLSLLLVLGFALMVTIATGSSVRAVDWSDYDWRPLLKKGDVEIYAAEEFGHKVIPGNNNIRVGRKEKVIPMKINFETHDLSDGDLVYFKIARFGMLETFNAAEEILKNSSTKRAHSTYVGGAVTFRFFLDPEKAQVHPWFTDVSLGAKVFQESMGGDYIAHPNTPCKFNLKY